LRTRLTGKMLHWITVLRGKRRNEIAKKPPTQSLIVLMTFSG
jgi:hypothetical protein